MSFEIIDHTDDVLTELSHRAAVALEKCGLTGEKYAKEQCPVDTGALRNSITHTVNDKTVYVGTNSEYGVYVECGTGKNYPGGRDTPWAFQDSKGEWHTTRGSKAQPFIKPAIADHIGTYKAIIVDSLK